MELNQVYFFIIINILLLIICSELTSCAEILLVMPLPFKSHFYAMSPLITSLADKGHKITAYTAIPFGPHQNITDIFFEYKMAEKLKINDMTTLNNVVSLSLAVHDIGYYSAVNFLKTPQFEELISTDHKFDALITTSITVQEYLAALHHRFNNTLTIEFIPHAHSSSASFLTPIPFNPSYYVDVKLAYNDRMDFWQRLHNTYSWVISVALLYLVNFRTMSNLVDKHMIYPGWQQRPHIKDLILNKSLILINGHFSVSYPYPLPPNVIDIAGINIRENQPLPKEINKFINSWPNGVVILSWGSVVSGKKINNEQTDINLITAFSSLKYGVIWKTEKVKFPIAIPDNVMILKWLPQQDVLAHKNIKVFVTHGGFNSVVEAVNYGIPVVATPFFYDQKKNAKKLTDIGMALTLDSDNITKESLVWAIDEVASNPRFKVAAMKRSAMFRDRPMPPLKEAVYWIEYIIRHGDVLRPSSSNLPMYQLLLLDIMAFFFTIIILILYLLKLLIRKLSFKRIIVYFKKHVHEKSL